jgi:hypothetical protein
MYLPILADTALPGTIDVDDLLGSAKRLTVFDATSLSIIHPIIAQEVLAKCLVPNDGNQPWRTFLADFCVGFIVSLGRSPEAYGESIEVILTQLFLERSIWDDTNQPRLFSNLIETIPTREGQRRVLECLCATFPSNAHFWNHLGRHLNLRIRAPYIEAEKCFQHAIELEPQNEIHHHGLGMVYRIEVRSRLEKPLDRSQTLLERIAATDAIFDQPSNAFARLMLWIWETSIHL